MLLLATILCASASLVPSEKPIREHAQADANGVLVWADTKLWRYAPVDTEQWLTVIGVDLLNTNDHDIDFRLEDLRLIDDKGHVAAPFFIPTRNGSGLRTNVLWKGVQRFPPNNDDLESLVRYGTDGVSSVFATDDRRSSASPMSFREAFGIGMVPTDWNPTQIRYVRTPHALTLRAIFNRRIAAGERAHGYLAFPRPQEDATAVWLVWRLPNESARIRFDVKDSSSLALR